eukprot:569377-Hanusia_phi.AAC.1
MSGEEVKSNHGNLYDGLIKAHSEIDIVKIQTVRVETMEEVREMFSPITSAMNRYRPRLGNAFFKILALFEKEHDEEF